jgi:hypothetical protein
MVKMVSTFAEGLLQRSRAAEPICSFCEGARAADMRAAPANSRKVLGGESFEHDREGHRGEKLLEVASEWRRRARPKSVALSGTWTL